MSIVMLHRMRSFHLYIMRRALSVLFALLFIVPAFGTTFWPKESHFKYQLGATFGVNGISAGAADFPGSHWGIYVRVGKHTCGFRREWDGEFVKLWGDPFYFERTGVYYGWSAVYKNVQWGPQAGFGILTYNHATTGNVPSLPQEESMYGEIAVNGLLNVRGNGVGAKIFFNVNRFEPMVGATFYLQFGFAWNGKSDKNEEN